MLQCKRFYSTMTFRSDRQRKAMFAKMNNGKDSVPQSAPFSSPNAPVKKSFFTRLKEKESEARTRKVQREAQELGELRKERLRLTGQTRIETLAQKERREIARLKAKQKEVKQAKFRESRTGRFTAELRKNISKASKAAQKASKKVSRKPRRKTKRRSSSGGGLIDLV